MPVFLTMTQGLSNNERKAIVRRATIVAIITIINLTLSGQFLFKFFGLSTNGFRIAGGFVIFKIGFDMLQARYSNAKLSDEEVKTYMNDISITPLAIPMLCGPGAIANAIMLMEDAHTITLKIALICTIAFVACVISGIVPVFINYEATAEEFIHSARRSELTRFITERRFQNKLSDFCWPRERDLIYAESELREVPRGRMAWMR